MRIVFSPLIKLNDIYVVVRVNEPIAPLPVYTTRYERVSRTSQIQWWLFLHDCRMVSFKPQPHIVYITIIIAVNDDFSMCKTEHCRAVDISAGTWNNNIKHVFMHMCDLWVCAHGKQCIIMAMCWKGVFFLSIHRACWTWKLANVLNVCRNICEIF